jgi:hypothetical protein
MGQASSLGKGLNLLTAYGIPIFRKPGPVNLFSTTILFPPGRNARPVQLMLLLGAKAVASPKLVDKLFAAARIVDTCQVKTTHNVAKQHDDNRQRKKILKR